MSKPQGSDLGKIRAQLDQGIGVSHESLGRLMESNVLPLNRATVDGRFLEMNEAMSSLLGYTRDELLSGSVTWRDLTPPEYVEKDLKAIEEIRTIGRAGPWEKEFIHKDGHRVPVLIGVAALDASATDCVCFTVDLTPLKEATAELKSSEERFRLLADAIPQMVWTADIDGRTDYCNGRFYEYVGYSPEDEDGFLWKKVVHPEDLGPCELAGKEATSKCIPFEMEMRYRRYDGEYRWHLVRAIPIADSQQRVAKWFGTCTDIHDKKTSEEELKESELRFRTLAEAIPNIVWTANAKGEITFFNGRFFEYTGLSPEQSRDEGWNLLLHPEDLQLYKTGWSKAVETGDSLEFEFRLRRAVGVGTSSRSYRWHLCRAVALRSEQGNIVEWFGTWTDIHRSKTKR